jgi:predicted dehydrogenase
MKMSEGSGFTSMADAKATGEVPEIGIGMLGYAFMGKAHSHAVLTSPHMMYPPPAIPRLVGIAGRHAEAVQEAARRYGYEHAYTDWREMLANDEVQLFDNGGPNDAHAEPCIAAAQAGKHVLCEKPLGRTAEESKTMLEAVQKAGVKHMVAFNYRFVPAIRQIRKLIDSGALGQIYHFRATYLQEWIMPHYNTPLIWRLQKNQAGSGALGDLGAHIIDLARYLVGEVKSVSAMTKTFIPERPKLDG